VVATNPLVPGSSFRFKKGLEDTADLLLHKSLAIQEMQYPQLSQQEENITKRVRFVAATSGQIRKINPITLKPLPAPFLNLSW